MLLRRTIGILSVFVLLFVTVAEAGYDQGAYYSQSTYYSQASYQVTFTDDVTGAKDFTVLGHVSKGSGTFLIDHPLDPKNKLLYHSFVESPDAKDWYDGVAALDNRGEALVTLPNYFGALNKNFRYQLKPIGAPMPDLRILKGVVDNQFTIGGGVAGGRVSWQITGIRKDPYIEANPIRVEVEKAPGELVERGELAHESAYPSHVPSLRALISRIHALTRW